MKLHLYTRAYITPDGIPNITKELISSIDDFLMLDVENRVTWHIVVSNTLGLGVLKIVKYLRDNGMNYMNKVRIYTVQYKLSASSARVYALNNVYNYIRMVSHRDITDATEHVAMNIDADDKLINQEDLITLVNSLGGQAFDLLAFGIDAIPKPNEFTSWDFHKAIVSYRRYCTENTQTMFLFMHRAHLIPNLILGIERPINDPNESCEDFKLAINAAAMHGLRISAVRQNFIEYHIHEGQVSENQTSAFKLKLQERLKSLGYLYVNTKFYKFSMKGKLRKYNPYE